MLVVLAMLVLVAAGTVMHLGRGLFADYPDFLEDHSETARAPFRLPGEQHDADGAYRLDSLGNLLIAVMSWLGGGFVAAWMFGFFH